MNKSLRKYRAQNMDLPYNWMNKSLHEQVITEVQGSKYGFATQLDKTKDV